LNTESVLQARNLALRKKTIENSSYLRVEI
jgi:hypothetical protein